MQLPLLFNFRQPVSGRGFRAGVVMCGRALLEVEDGEHWITGVAPAGFAGGGMTRDEAFADFRRGWAEIIFDIAAEAPTFEHFKAQCEEFLDTTKASFDAEWLEALARVRRENVSEPGLTSLPADDHQVSFQVVELVAATAAPEENKLEEGLLAAA